MSTSLATRSFSVVTNKAGKVSQTASRAHTAISGASAPVQLGLAIHGSAITRRTAISGFEVVTLESMLALPSIDGSQWPDVYALMADKFGYSIEAGRGKAACKAMLEYAQTGIDGKKIIASTDGCTDSQHTAITNRQILIDLCNAAMAAWQVAADKATAAAAAITDSVTA
jgi:hypothetical protein